MTTATGTSSSMRCRCPTTAASYTPGTKAITHSISGAATFSPPTLSMSLSRSAKVMLPSVSNLLIAGDEPAVGREAVLRRLRIVEVLQEDLDASHAPAFQMSSLAGRNGRAIGAQDADAAAGQKAPSEPPCMHRLAKRIFDLGQGSSSVYCAGGRRQSALVWRQPDKWPCQRPRKSLISSKKRSEAGSCSRKR